MRIFGFNFRLKLISWLLTGILIYPMILSSSEDFTGVDDHVNKTPDAYSRNLVQLTHYLVKPYTDERSRARAIFRWISSHIVYDVNAYLNGKRSTYKPQDVLRTRMAVCEGYARLFKRMANIAGLKAEIVRGYSKGYNYQTGKIFTRSNSHAWNAVQIDGQWQLLDATWGAGYIDENNKYVKEFNDYYFLTPPEQLIHSHFPDVRSWQLLKKEWNRVDFEQSVQLKPTFFQYKMQVVSHPRMKIEATKNLTVELKGPQDVQLIARLLSEGEELNPMYTFVNQQQGKFEILAVFPKTAHYILRVFANRNDKSNAYKWILDYAIDAQGDGNIIGFPEKYTLFDSLNGYLIRPLNRFLPPLSKTEFRLRLNGVQKVVVITGQEIKPLQYDGSAYRGNATIKKGETVIAAQLKNDRRLHYLLRYVN